MSDEELAIHDVTFKITHQLIVSISELAKNLEWQDATHASEIDIFSPLWTNVSVCLQNLVFFKEFMDEKNSVVLGVSTQELHEAIAEIEDGAMKRFLEGSKQRECDNLTNALKLLTNQQKDGESPIGMIVTGLLEKVGAK